MIKHKLIKCHVYDRFSYRYRDFYIQEICEVSYQNKKMRVKLIDWVVVDLEGDQIHSCKKPKPTRREMIEWVDCYYDKLEGAN